MPAEQLLDDTWTEPVLRADPRDRILMPTDGGSPAWLAALLVAVLALGAAGTWQWKARQQLPVAAAASATPATAKATPAAVLPTPPAPPAQLAAAPPHRVSPRPAAHRHRAVAHAPRHREPKHVAQRPAPRRA